VHRVQVIEGWRGRRIRGRVARLAVAATLLLPQAAWGGPGDLDPAFSGDGIATTSFGGSETWDDAHAIAVQADGKLVTGGYTIVARTLDFALTRHLPDGSLDLSFGDGGRLLPQSDGAATDSVKALTVQPDGRLVAVGTKRRSWTESSVSRSQSTAAGTCAGSMWWAASDSW
jgi:uncharacterized delta-60 repeat protein